MFTVAIQYPGFGPQHPPRLKAIFDQRPDASTRVVAMEMFRKDSDYAWNPVATKDSPYYRHTVMDCESAVGRRAGRRLRDAVWNSLDHVNPDVLVVNGWGHRESRHSLNWARKRRRKVVLLSDSAFEDAPRTWYKEFIKRWIIRGSRSAFVAGTPQAQYARRLGVPSEKVFHPGSCVVDNDYWEESAARIRGEDERIRRSLNLPQRYFLYVGRFIPKKNVPFLVRAYADYRRRSGSKPWGLVLCGDGPEADRIHAEIRRTGAPDVATPGFAQVDTLPSYYALASCFIMPSSHFEQWGLVANEAMACGLPVLISTQCGCAQDLVENGVNGSTFDPFDQARLSALMHDLSRNEGRLESMGAASRRIVAGHSCAVAARNLWKAVKAA